MLFLQLVCFQPSRKRIQPESRQNVIPLADLSHGGGFRPLLTQNTGVPNQDFSTASVTT